MPRVSPKQTMQVLAGVTSFPGFAAPTSNTTFTPNQFFDVCVPNYSRGVVRLVGFLIRQALGWCDADGNPQHERIRLPYRDLVSRAGIARGEIRKSLDEAIRGGFIECVEPGKASSAHSPAETASYQLRWDDRPEYIKDPQQFRGFFGGEGNRTDIPNQFFDRVIPTEPLSVIKVVASIIRFSIGFQARHGRRRQQVHLSYSDIQRYAHLRDRHTLADALRTAEARNYIFRIDDGYFDRDAGRLSRPGQFTLRWADTLPLFMTGSKNPPAEIESDQFENPTGTGSKNQPMNRSENPTGIETKQGNEISKQQQAEAETQGAYALLKREGFTGKAATELASKFPEGQIRSQIDWLPQRAPSRNRLGMLRRAIEENWKAPEELRHAEVFPGREFARHFYAGLAGNAGLPVAEPSTRDVELAGQFIQRLLATKPVKTDMPTWAREFAAYVSERKREQDVVSLVLALRTHGDAWLLRFGREQQRQQGGAQQSAREQHRAKHEATWLRFLAESEAICRAQRTDAYDKFLREHRSSRWQPSAADPERLRLFAFQRAFQLPDFWHWDAEFNPQPFQPCA